MQNYEKKREVTRADIRFFEAERCADKEKSGTPDGASGCMKVVMFLSQTEYQGLCSDYSEEHCKRVYGGVCYCRSVVAGGVVGIGEGRGIGATTGHKTHDSEEIDFVVSAGDASYNDQRHHCDNEAPDNPPHAGGVEYGSGEVLAGCNADGSEEEAYAEFAKEQRCRT